MSATARLRRLLRAPHRAYRASGADLPWGDPLAAHDVAMEGYFWRFTDPATGRVVIALNGVNRDAEGNHWATLGLAAHPHGFLRTVEHPTGHADPQRLGWLPLLAGVAMTRAVRELGVARAGVKWPNDVLVDGHPDYALLDPLARLGKDEWALHAEVVSVPRPSRPEDVRTGRGPRGEC